MVESAEIESREIREVVDDGSEFLGFDHAEQQGEAQEGVLKTRGHLDPVSVEPDGLE